MVPQRIAQRVVGSDVVNQNGDYLGKATTSITWGISTYFIYDAIHKMIEELKRTEDDEGNPIDNDNKNISISFNAGEGSFPKSSFDN